MKLFTKILFRIDHQTLKMKSVLLFSLFLVIQAAPNQKTCGTSEDCDEDECCVGKNPFRAGSCEPLAGLNEFCVPELMMELLGKDYNHGGCPCAKGLKCEPEQVITEEGEIHFKNPKCKQTSSD
ncbi:toxin CSTX-20-like [Centruroides vittatus]|uniref:toxin CSTX-20-like n=1 Tax=Centruroides vittatus TaxID=120091 RepID=UPI0035108D13